MPMSTSITEMVPDRNLFTGERRTSPKQLPRRDVLAIRALDIGIASILLIFLAFQRRFIEGIATTGIK